MINGKSVLALMPARGGSKGVKRKNIREMAGKPLIAWTIEAARNSRYIDRLILSSEDQEIIDIAMRWGCEVPFVRPMELAQDDTPGIEPVLHAIRHVPGYDYIVLLQPTSPLREAQDIDACLELSDRHQGQACVSVTEPEKSPYWMYKLDSEQFMSPLILSNEIYTKRQDLPKVVALNGAVYVSRCDGLLDKKTFLSNETRAYIMPKERSVDIDTELDLKYAELVLLSGKRSQVN